MRRIPIRAMGGKKLLVKVLIDRSKTVIILINLKLPHNLTYFCTTY